MRTGIDTCDTNILSGRSAIQSAQRSVAASSSFSVSAFQLRFHLIPSVEANESRDRSKIINTVDVRRKVVFIEFSGND